MTWLSTAAQVVGVLGFVIAVINTAWSIRRDRVRLKLDAMFEMDNPIWTPRSPRLFLRIANASYFPVSVRRILMSRSRWRTAIPVDFGISLGAEMPHKIPQGEDIQLILTRRGFRRADTVAEFDPKTMRRVGVETVTGERFWIGGRSVKQFALSPDPRILDRSNEKT